MAVRARAIGVPRRTKDLPAARSGHARCCRIRSRRATRHQLTREISMGNQQHAPNESGMADCIAACNECNRTCLQHIEHCLALGGSHSEPEHISMLLTCASVCRVSAELMAIDSDWYATMCDLCAQVCDECADTCEDLGDMEACVAACQDCAEECRAMVDDGDEDEDEDEEEDEEEDEAGDDEEGEKTAADERMN
jgi:hypothetical protein